MVTQLFIILEMYCFYNLADLFHFPIETILQLILDV